MTERRHDRRFAPPLKPEVRSTLRPGCAVRLVEVSASGALVHAPRPLRPGARVHLQVAVGPRRYTIAASVLRCLVWSLDAAGVTYRGALRFEHRVEWAWAEPTRHVPVMPEHIGPTGTDGGKRLPAGVGHGCSLVHEW